MDLGRWFFLLFLGCCYCGSGERSSTLINGVVSSDWSFSLPAVAGVGGLAGLLIVRNRPLPPLPATADKDGFGCQHFYWVVVVVDY